jgi:hypothetical protein
MFTEAEKQDKNLRALKSKVIEFNLQTVEVYNGSNVEVLLLLYYYYYYLNFNSFGCLFLILLMFVDVLLTYCY